MNRKRALIIILILFTGLFPLIPIPMAKAYSKTVYITSDYDDVWITETGNMFPSTSMVIMLDDETGLRSFLRFQNVPVARTVKINNATLYVYAGEVQPTSPGASVTIYGIDEPDCAPFSVGSGLWSLERPYTSAHVNWNLTSWSMGWHSVDVTNIIEEIINQYAWNTNNSLGFQILGVGDSGHEPRSFEDYYHPYRESQAKLTIVYDVIEEEEEPPGDPEFVEQYGPYTIWLFPGVPGGNETLSYVFTEGTGSPYDVMYDTIHDAPGTPVSVSSSVDSGVTAGHGSTKLTRTSNGTLYCVYHTSASPSYQSYLKKSENNGTTWTDVGAIGAGMEGYDQWEPTVAIDSNDYLHFLWQGKSASWPTTTKIWYRNYTGSWSDIVHVSVGTAANQYWPSLAVDSNNYLHAAWAGAISGGNIFYSSYTTGSWSIPLDISTQAGAANSAKPDIAVDSDDYLHVVYSGYGTGYVVEQQIWYTKYTASWSGPIVISTLAGMTDNWQQYSSLSIGSNDYIHVVWVGEDTEYSVDQVWYNKYTVSWSGPIRISTADGMDVRTQYHPFIAVDSDDSIHVLWDGKATGYTDYEKVWYAKYRESWSIPGCLQPTGKNRNPNLRWSNWWSNPMEDGEDTEDTFIVTDENGTIVDTWTLNGNGNFTDIDDLKDFIDDYIDPGGGDPLDPTPGTQGFPDEGPFTRFNMRLYFLVIGLGCIFGPLWAMGYKKLDSVGYAWCALLMILGTGLLWSIVGI